MCDVHSLPMPKGIGCLHHLSAGSLVSVDGGRLTLLTFCVWFYRKSLSVRLKHVEASEIHYAMNIVVLKLVYVVLRVFIVLTLLEDSVTWYPPRCGIPVSARAT